MKDPEPTTPGRGQRECRCARVNHQHGTRTAYQRDRCRCTPCRTAHADHARLRRLRHAQQTWCGGSDWQPADPTILRLRALAADGWTLRDLAPALGVTYTAVHQLRSKDKKRVLTSTAVRVEALFDQLGLPEMNRDRRLARDRARARGWQTSLALDLTNDMHTPITEISKYGDLLDEVAIEEAMHGRHVTLTRGERSEAVRRLTVMGHSADEIALRLGISEREVCRTRTRIRDAQEAA